MLAAMENHRTDPILNDSCPVKSDRLLGGETFRYDPLPAALVARRRRLRFIYFDGKDLRPLNLAAVTALSEL